MRRRSTRASIARRGGAAPDRRLAVRHAAVGVRPRDGVVGDARRPRAPASRWASVTKLVDRARDAGRGRGGRRRPGRAGRPAGLDGEHLLAHASGLAVRGAAAARRARRRRDLLEHRLSRCSPSTSRRARRCRSPTYLRRGGPRAARPRRDARGVAGGRDRTERSRPARVRPRAARRRRSSRPRRSPRRRACSSRASRRAAGLRPLEPERLGPRLRAPRRKPPHWTGARNSPRTFGHFGSAGTATFLWIDPERAARRAPPWPTCRSDRGRARRGRRLSDAVLSEGNRAAAR